MLTLGRMALAGEDGKGLLALSSVGWFSRLPWLEYAGGLAVPPVCHLALVAAGAPLGVSGEDAQRVSQLTTTRGGPAVVRPVGKSPRFDVPARLFHGGWSDSPAR